MGALQHRHVRRIEINKQLGYTEAEAYLRAMAATDPKAAAEVAELDRDYAAHRQVARDRNARMANAIGQNGKVSVPQLIAALAADPELFTWLCERVHLTVAHARPPRDEE